MFNKYGILFFVLVVLVLNLTAAAPAGLPDDDAELLPEDFNPGTQSNDVNPETDDDIIYINGRPYRKPKAPVNPPPVYTTVALYPAQSPGIHYLTPTYFIPTYYG